jgi:uncharacterized protein YndB with AHSA1/START domain
MKLVKTIFLKAPRAHVWTFLTQADRLALWFHQGEKDVAAGGEWALVTNSLGREGQRMCWGHVRVFEPPARLVHTFTHQGLAGVETTCTWELEEADGGTVLTLTHDGFERAGEGAFNKTSDHDKGWDEHFVRLRRVVS